MTAANSAATSMDSALQHGRSYRNAIAAVHIIMAFTGVMTTLLGPLLPALVAHWKLNDSQAGAFFTCQFLGSMTGVLLSGLLGARLGPRRCMALGAGLMSLGIGAMSFAPWLAALVCTWVYGVGLGFAIPAANLFIANVNSARRGAALNLLNFSWGVGAIASPWLVDLLGGRGLSTLLLVLALAIAAVSPLLLAATWPEVSLEDPKARAESKVTGQYAAILRFAALFFFYVGTEATVSGWLTTYAERMHMAMARVAVLMPSFFWAALLAGRALAPVVLRKVEEARLGLAGLAVGGAGVMILVLSLNLAGVAAGSVVAGFGLAAIFPLLISAVTHRFGASATRITSAMFLMSALGGASLPFLAGFASAHLGSLRAAMLVALASDLIMLVLARNTFVQRTTTES